MLPRWGAFFLCQGFAFSVLVGVMRGLVPVPHLLNPIGREGDGNAEEDAGSKLLLGKDGDANEGKRCRVDE